MKKALLLAPMASVQEKFNSANIIALTEIGYEVHLAANFSLSEHDKLFAEQMNGKGIVIHDLPFSRGSLLKNLEIIPQIKKILSDNNFQIVHSHTETGGILTRLSMSADRNAKYIYTPHGMSFYKGGSMKSQIIYRPVEKWICSKMDANIAINSEEYEVLKRWNEKSSRFVHGIGLNTEKTRNTEIDFSEKRKEFGIPENATVVLSIGELNENKNHQVVIKALAEIDNDNIYYLICGEGEKKQFLRDLAAENGLGDRLILAGYRYDISEILKMVDLFVFPSFHEGLPVSVMEAMAAGLPVVCSQIRGNVDLIENGEGGFLCSPDSVSEFRDAIEKLCNDKTMREKMGKKNAENINRFSFDAVKNELVQIYS